MQKDTLERSRAIKLTAVNKQIQNDARNRINMQDHPVAPTATPVRIRRSGAAGIDWSISRSMTGYSCVSPETLSIQGAAPKWILINDLDPNDFYIAKLGSKNGKVEVFTELFSNELGAALGFDMAHHGLVRLDEHYYFLTRNFKKPGFALVHGSLLIADALQASESEIHNISRKSEQQFYEIGLVKEAIARICGSHADQVFQKMIDMLVFDAIIGCNDRHAMNWGILRPERPTMVQASVRSPQFSIRQGVSRGI
jgi:hypothetical protein